jgi:hypothetical protein
MIRIYLKPGVYTLIDDEDYPKVCAYCWTYSNGYAEAVVNGNRVYLHRFLMKCKDGEEVDHEDRNRLNNQRYNLRVATRSTNMANTGLRSNNTSGYKGVYPARKGKPFRAEISVRGKGFYIGGFDTAIDAARAYDTWAKEIFGDFAVLNFPEIVSG